MVIMLTSAPSERRPLAQSPCPLETAVIAGGAPAGSSELAAPPQSILPRPGTGARPGTAGGSPRAPKRPQASPASRRNARLPLARLLLPRCEGGGHAPFQLGVARRAG